LISNGAWAVEITQDGVYEIELRRWPRQVNESLEATHARLRIGDEQWKSDVLPNATESLFRVSLSSGPAMLQTWLTMPNGQTRGAYYVYVRRVSDVE